MSFKILYITASSLEADSLRNVKGINASNGKFYYGSIEIEMLVAGVGLMATSWSLKQWLSTNEKPDLALNGGIAGSYKDEYRVGSTVMPVSDCFADAGIEDGDDFIPLHEAGLSNKNDFPFKDGFIIAQNDYIDKLYSVIQPVRAITVNTATGSEKTREKLVGRYHPDIETMEGAAVFYICAREGIPFAAIRSISNMVERRDRNKWNIPQAVASLTFKLKEVLNLLDE
jgi:futalosine hydrolase